MADIDKIVDDYISYHSDREQNLCRNATRTVDALYYDYESKRDETVKEHYKKLFYGIDQVKDNISKERIFYRSPFQIDRDRILYSGYFLRLSDKTQVISSRERFVENRMSHTLKVVQLAKSISYGLRLNSDLCEAIAFGHDIGHPPFGHAAEKNINEWLKKQFKGQEKQLFEPTNLIDYVKEEYHASFNKFWTFGNDPDEDFFMHGRQGVRFLTSHYQDSRRTKFSSQTLFGIWKHSLQHGIDNSKFEVLSAHPRVCILKGEKSNTLEAQVVRLADDIATVYDLVEAIKLNIVKKEIIEKEIHSLCDNEELQYLEYSIKELIENINAGRISDLVTYFTYRIIGNSKPENKEVGFGDDFPSQKGLKCLRDIVKNTLHKYLAKNDQLNAVLPVTLIEWYMSNPQILVEEYAYLRKSDPLYPYYIIDDTGDEISKVTQIKKETDFVLKVSFATDFVAGLAEHELWNFWNVH